MGRRLQFTTAHLLMAIAATGMAVGAVVAAERAGDPATGIAMPLILILPAPTAGP